MGSKSALVKTAFCIWEFVISCFGDAGRKPESSTRWIWASCASIKARKWSMSLS